MDYKRRYDSRYRKKSPKYDLRGILIISALSALILLALILMLTRNGCGKTPASQPAGQPANTPLPTETPAPTPAASDVPEAVNDVANSVYAALRPTAKEGWLPVFDSIATSDKVIAVTIDDCYQGENLWTIIRLAENYGAKLTIFPIGENIIRKTQSEALLYAWQNGFEIENHTYTHNNLYQCSDEELAEEIYRQNLAISRILNVEYKCRFLRPMGGDAKNDQRIHAYLKQLGYKGVAHWSESGTRNIDKLAGILKPGQIYLFHTTDADVKRLEYFIPYAVSQGYRLVTMNELFGYPPNEYSPLETPADDSRPVPTLAPYETVPVPYAKGSHAYGVLLMQERLIELGYLKDGADGIYGDNTANAVSAFQSAAGLPVTGKADTETQARIFAFVAPPKMP